MKVAYRDSIEYKALQLVEKSADRVLLRKDFSHLGSYRQVSRALKKLIEKKRLVKIGHGIYAKAYESKYLDVPLIEGGFDIAAREALNRMGVDWKPGSAEEAYNARQTQQVPVQNVVRLKSRLRRKITYVNRQLYFEGNANAR
ncbi:MAG: hypothetical protein CMF50_05775 [Legionellales bacterium]|mgnify:CR=1 FL=1|nr:hypothetical protein [Legionellales bacterium]|tara:strand:+ start:31228 stop:31656 length:429 start_codon:yes stop_codon:yes gene_type:complete